MCPQKDKIATLLPRSWLLSIENSIPHSWPCIHVVYLCSCSLHALAECLRVRGAVEIAGGSDTGTGNENGAGGTGTDVGSSEADTVEVLGGYWVDAALIAKPGKCKNACGCK